MEQPYKGQDYLLKAIKLCEMNGLSVKAMLVGEGRLRPDLEGLCNGMRLESKVEFRGSVPWGATLFELYDEADMFIMCSLTEGLGKALLEAMARGLPAVGTEVGGIPELLTPEVLVAPADARALASKIMELASDPGKLEQLSKRNFDESLNTGTKY